MRDITLEDTIDIKFTTRQFSTGAPFALVSGVISAYPGNSTTQLTAGITLTADFDGVTGLNNVRVAATNANGYATGTDYMLVITTGTVDSVSVVGEVIGEFSIGRGAAFARLGAPAGASTAADIAAVKVDTAATLVDTNELQTDWVNGGRLDNILDARSSQASVDSVASDSAAILIDTSTTLDDLVDDLETRLTSALATALQAHGLGIGRGVMAAGSTTTSLVFSTVNGAAPSAVNDFYNGRHIIFTSGALTLQACSITDYVGATTTATVSALTGAPADTVTFIIV